MNLQLLIATNRVKKQVLETAKNHNKGKAENGKVKTGAQDR